MSAMIPLPKFVYIFGNVYGVQLAGVYVSCALYGVSCLQVFMYYMSRAKDPPFLAALPGWLILVETIHQALLCVAIYKICIDNFGNENVLNLVIPELFISTFFQGLVTFSAHLFYIFRIWKFSKKNIFVPLICIPLTTLQLGMTFANNAYVLKEGEPTAVNTIIWTTYITHAVNVFLDFVFVVAMTYLLHEEKKTRFRSTNRLINRLIIYSINTGLATTTATLLTIILLATAPNTLIYGFFDFLISPLYVNSVLANLNSREYIRGDASAQVSTLDFTPATPNGSSRPHELRSLKFNHNPRMVRGSETQLDEPGYETTTTGSGLTKTIPIDMA